MIEIKDWMSKPVLTIKEDATLTAAAKKMVQKGVGCIVATSKDQHPVGIVTERDMLKIVAKQLDVKKTLVRDVMSRKLKTLPVTASMLEVSRLMKQGKVRRILITEDGEIVGVVTASDLIRLMSI